MSLVLTEIHEWRIHLKLSLRSMFGLKREDVGGYSVGIMGIFIMRTVHRTGACRCDQTEMNEMAAARSTQ